jgi:hypothetical protein
MKKILLLLLLLPSPALAWDNWTLNGMPIKEIKATEFAAGLLTSFAVHWLGHAAYLESQGIEWEQRGLQEYVTQPMENKHWRRHARAGFVAQLVGGTVLSQTKWARTSFARGYHLGTYTEIATHPFIWGADSEVHLITAAGGDGLQEQKMYAAWAQLLMAGG